MRHRKAKSNAWLRLEDEFIDWLLRMDILQESTVYRSIQAEAEARAELRKQREIALNLLRRGVTIDIIAPSTGLSTEEVQQLHHQMNVPPQS